MAGSTGQRLAEVITMTAQSFGSQPTGFSALWFILMAGTEAIPREGHLWNRVMDICTAQPARAGAMEKEQCSSSQPTAPLLPFSRSVDQTVRSRGRGWS